MAWNTIRPAAIEDYTNLNHNWARFIEKYPEIRTDRAYHNGDLEEFDIDSNIPNRKRRAKELSEMWRKRRERIVGTRDGIAMGYVGYHVD